MKFFHLRIIVDYEIASFSTEIEKNIISCKFRLGISSIYTNHLERLRKKLINLAMTVNLNLTRGHLSLFGPILAEQKATIFA